MTGRMAILLAASLALTTAAGACPGGKGTCDNKSLWEPKTHEVVAGSEEDGWTKYAGNPVFNKGAEGEWDAGGVTCFVVRRLPWGFRMYYSCAGDYARGFGLATSDDGVNWERHENNPVMAPDSGVTVWGPEVLHDGERYHMWYVARGQGMDGICHATSDDGVAWVQSENNPVIDHGGCVAVIWDGERYRLFLQHSTRRQHGFELHLSDDGENWENRGFTYLSGPVNTWDEITAAPSVAYYEGKLHFWYTGADTVGNARGEISIGHCVSDDWGESWNLPEARSDLRALRPSERWEGRGLYSSGVDFDGEKVYVWYAATGQGGGFGFASKTVSRVIDNRDLQGERNLWSVSPNPAAGAVKINYMGTLAAPVTVALHDISGRLALSRNFAAYEPLRIDPAAEGLPQGEYIVWILRGSKVVHRRLAVVK